MTGIDVAERQGAERWLALLPVAFFLTGATSLVFESVWFRRLTLLFGSTGYAAATVFTAFMSGLALGSLVAGRFADGPRWDRRRLLRAYALVEASIGISALVLPLSGESLLPLLVAGLRIGSGPAWGTLLRFVLAMVVLVVPTTLMGATLPLAGKAFAERGSGHLGAQVGRLYAANTLGAVMGTLATGFVLLPMIGVRATTVAAAATNLTVAALVLVLARGVPEGRRGPAAEQAAASISLRAKLALLVFAVSGGIAMVYEEVWQRALQLVIGSSVYSFAILLASYLFGLAAGAAVYSKRTASQPGQAQNLAVAELLVAATAAAGLVFLDDLPAVFLVVLRLIPLSPAPALLAQAALAASVVLLPTFFLGMLFPAMLSWHAGPPHEHPRRGAARAIGRVYAANAAGAIVGSFLGGFVFIPLLGLQRTLVALVAASGLIGLAFALIGGSRRGIVGVAAAATLLLALVPMLSRPWNLRAMNAGVFRVSTASDVASGLDDDLAPESAPGMAASGLSIDERFVVRSGFETVRSSTVLEHRDGITTTVAITETVLDTQARGVVMTAYALRVNGKPDASLTVRHRMGEPPTAGTILPSGDMETQVLSGALPLFVDLPAGDALVIGWGSGITVATLSQGLAPTGRRVVAVELEPEVVRVSRVFSRFVSADPRNVVTRLEDGRNLLLLDDRRYATIVSEPSNPWVSGASNLFTEEFFRLVRRRLAPRGVFVQWLQAYEISVDSVRSVLGALGRVFRSVAVLRMVHSRGDLLIVCSDRPVRWLKPGAPLPSVLSVVGLASAEDVASRVIAPGHRVRAFAKGAPPNRDDLPFVEFRAPLDLVSFGRWGSDVIVGALAGRLDRPPEAAGLDRLRLARSLVSAGRPDAALALDPGGPTAQAARRMIEGRSRAPSDREAWADLPARLAEWRARPEDSGRREAVGDAYLALGYPERAAALYLGLPGEARPPAPPGHEP